MTDTRRADELVPALHEGWTQHATAAGEAVSPVGLPAGEPIVLPALLPDELEARDVWLRRRFTLDAAADARLVLPVVGPIAELFVDGEPRDLTRSLHRTHELVLGLSAGEHELAICLRSPTLAWKERRPRPRWKTRLVAQQQLRFLRAPLLGRIPSWSSTGAPRGVLVAPRLMRVGELRAEDVRLAATLRGGHGRVTVRLPSWVSAARGELRVGDTLAPLTTDDDGALRGELAIVDPPRWWPHTHGSQPRVPVAVVLDGAVLELGEVGFRTVEIDPDPRRFGLCVNGERIFCRGAVFVPPAATLDFAPTRRALEALRDAGGNMVRIGGTMRYEDAAFFDTCDELGLLVWQDFMFANMDYPVEDPSFAAEVVAEVDEQLERWARHPSVAVLCGGSEVAQQAAMMGQPPERWYGPLFEKLLPSRCQAILPDVPYVLGSPCSPLDGDGAGEPPPLPFRVDRGVAHYYGVGAYLRPFDDARRADVTFASECLGISNVPEPEAVEAMFGDALAATHTPRWKAGVPRDNGAGWDFEDVRDHYLGVLFGQDALTLRYADAEGYLERSRIASAEIMTRTFTEWRRTGSTTRGGIVWTLRDLQAGAGWGLLDSDGREKSVMLALRQVWAPTALLCTDEGTNGVRLHVVHDGPTERTLTLRVGLYRGGELVVAQATREVIAPPRSALAYDVEGLLGGFRDVGYAYRFGPRAHDALLATLHDGEALVGEAAHLPSLPVSPPDAGLVVEGVREAPDRCRVKVHATRVALFVVLRVPGWRADAGYFHLAPGGSRTVVLHARAPGAAAPRGDALALGSAPVRLVIA